MVRKIQQKIQQEMAKPQLKAEIKTSAGNVHQIQLHFDGHKTPDVALIAGRSLHSPFKLVVFLKQCWNVYVKRNYTILKTGSGGKKRVVVKIDAISKTLGIAQKKIDKQLPKIVNKQITEAMKERKTESAKWSHGEPTNSKMITVFDKFVYTQAQMAITGEKEKNIRILDKYTVTVLPSKPEDKFHTQDMANVGSGTFKIGYLAINWLKNKLGVVYKKAQMQKEMEKKYTLNAKKEHLFYKKNETLKLPAVLGVHNIGTKQGTGLITKFADGGDLVNFINAPENQEIRKDEVKLAKLILPLIKTLKILHKKKIALRDIKPENIFVRNGKLKFADFGSAKKQKEKFKVFQGSPYHAAPEAILAEFSEKGYGVSSDLWSFGATLYELMNGKDSWAKGLGVSGVGKMQAMYTIAEEFSKEKYDKMLPKSKNTSTLTDCIRACTHTNPEKRITAAKLYKIVKQISERKD